MKRVVLNKIRLRHNRLNGCGEKIHRILFALFLIQFVFVWFRSWLPNPPLPSARWPDGLLLVLTTATTLAALARQLPGQNVMLAFTIIGIIAGAVQSLGTVSG